MILVPRRKLWTPADPAVPPRPAWRRRCIPRWRRSTGARNAASGEHVIRSDTGVRVVKSDGTFVVSDGTEGCCSWVQGRHCCTRELVEKYKEVADPADFPYVGLHADGYCYEFDLDANPCVSALPPGAEEFNGTQKTDCDHADCREGCCQELATICSGSRADPLTVTLSGVTRCYTTCTVFVATKGHEIRGDPNVAVSVSYIGTSAGVDYYCGSTTSGLIVDQFADSSCSTLDVTYDEQFVLVRATTDRAITVSSWLRTVHTWSCDSTTPPTVGLWWIYGAGPVDCYTEGDAIDNEFTSGGCGTGSPISICYGGQATVEWTC